MTSNDIRVDITFRNNLILTKMEERGIKNVSELCRLLNAQNPKMTNATEMGKLLNMKKPAQNQDGTWIYTALRLAVFFNCLPEDLFSDMQKQIALRNNRVKAEVSFSEIQALTARSSSSPEKLIEAKEFSGRTRAALASLSKRQEEVLRMRFGIGCKEMTQTQISKILGIAPARVQQIEAQGLRNLKKPSRSKLLAAGVVTSRQVQRSWGTSTEIIIDQDVMDALHDV